MSKKNLETEKSLFRTTALIQRTIIHNNIGSIAGELLAKEFINKIKFDKDSVIAGYWPIKNEISPVPLMEQLHQIGLIIALPTIIKGDNLLIFRKWEPNQQLEQGPFNTLQPKKNITEVVPSIILAPLLAFDKFGNRLGYGKGFYDRTLKILREKNSNLLFVGCAFDKQEIHSVPVDNNDQILDRTVTNTNVHIFR